MPTTRLVCAAPRPIASAKSGTSAIRQARAAEMKSTPTPRVTKVLRCSARTAPTERRRILRRRSGPEVTSRTRRTHNNAATEEARPTT
jgi:hypothetical protein